MIREPEGYSKWNPSMRGAFRKGYDAQKDGAGMDECPYKDKRTDTGKITWSRAYMSAWRDGWFWADKLEAIEDYYASRNESGQAALSK